MQYALDANDLRLEVIEDDVASMRFGSQPFPNLGTRGAGLRIFKKPFARCLQLIDECEGPRNIVPGNETGDPGEVRVRRGRKLQTPQPSATPAAMSAMRLRAFVKA